MFMSDRYRSWFIAANSQCGYFFLTSRRQPSDSVCILTPLIQPCVFSSSAQHICFCPLATFSECPSPSPPSSVRAHPERTQRRSELRMLVLPYTSHMSTAVLSPLFAILFVVARNFISFFHKFTRPFDIFCTFPALHPPPYL